MDKDYCNCYKEAELKTSYYSIKSVRHVLCVTVSKITWTLLLCMGQKYENNFVYIWVKVTKKCCNCDLIYACNSNTVLTSGDKKNQATNTWPFITLLFFFIVLLEKLIHLHETKLLKQFVYSVNQRVWVGVSEITFLSSDPRSKGSSEHFVRLTQLLFQVGNFPREIWVAFSEESQV